MNHQQNTAGYCLDDTLSQADQKNIALNTMTIVYLLRQNDYWTKRFSDLYALAVFLSDTSRGKKVLTTQQFIEFASILDVPAQELIKNAGQTKSRHAHFHQMLDKMGRFATDAGAKQCTVKRKETSVLSTKETHTQTHMPDSKEDFQLGALMGDILDSEDLSIGHLLD